MPEHDVVRREVVRRAGHRRRSSAPRTPAIRHHVVRFASSQTAGGNCPAAACNDRGPRDLKDDTTWERRHSASSTTSRASPARRRRGSCRTASTSCGWPTRPASAGYYLAEHHGSDLCMAPTQELFIAAASQMTQNDPHGPDGQAAPAPPPGATGRGHVRDRQPHQRPARVRRRSRRGADRALLVQQQLARVARPLRGRARHHQPRAAHR